MFLSFVKHRTMSSPRHTVTYELQESWVRFGGAAWTYFSIAQDEYELFLNAEADPIAAPNAEESGESYYAQERAQLSAAIKTIVFCGMALEAAIYDFAAIHLGDKYALEVLDKLDLRQKWLVVPRLVCGKSLDENGQGVNALRTVIRARNALVHAKSAKAVLEPAAIAKLQEKDEQLRRDAHESFKCVVLLSLDLNSLIGTPAGVLPPFERRDVPQPFDERSGLLLHRIVRAREIHARSDASQETPPK